MLTLEEIASMLGTFEGTEEAVKDLEEYGRVSEGANARIVELENEVGELNQRYTDTAARNYELMMASTAKASEMDDEAGEDDTEADDDVDISALFKERD